MKLKSVNRFVKLVIVKLFEFNPTAATIRCTYLVRPVYRFLRVHSIPMVVQQREGKWWKLQHKEACWFISHGNDSITVSRAHNITEPWTRVFCSDKLRNMCVQGWISDRHLNLQGVRYVPDIFYYFFFF